MDLNSPTPVNQHMNDQANPKSGINGKWIFISAFSFVCILIAISLVLLRSTGKSGFADSNEPRLPLTDPLVLNNPTDGITGFLKETLKPELMPKQKVKITKISDKAYQYKWNDGNVFYTSRIFMQNPVDSTNSGQAKVDMILLAVQIQTDQKVNLETTREYIGQYFQPVDSQNLKWSEVADPKSNLGTIIALKGDNMKGSRDWRGIVENPKNQTGPIYLYSLQACRIFPEAANFEEYKCIVN